MGTRSGRFVSYLTSLKTLLTRNALLIIAVNILNQYGNLMKNAFRPLYATQFVGVSTTLFGTALSVFLIASILCRPPAGAPIDSRHSILKNVLSVALALKGACWLCFAFVSNAGLLYVAFAVDGIIYAFCGTALPALLALTIDKKAIGGGYAIMMGVSNVITANARATGISLFNDYGVGLATGIAALTAFLGAALAFCISTKKILEAVKQDSSGSPTGKRVGGFAIRLLPMAIVGAMPIVMYNGETNFLQLQAESAGFDYLNTLTLAASCDGVITVIVGFLCDMLNPTIFVKIGLAGSIVGALLFSSADSSALFSFGIMSYYCTQFFDPALRITGMKLVAKSEQGSFQAMMIFCNDALSIVCNPLLGFIVGMFGYRAMWGGICIWLIAAFIGFLLLDRFFLQKLRDSARKQAELVAVRAVEQLKSAEQLQPEGQPKPAETPTSTEHQSQRIR